jgi:GDP-D-mannose 3', 5'-epimerase
MAHVAVLGAAGFIGSHLADRLEETDHVVRRVDLRAGPGIVVRDLRKLPGAVAAIDGCDWVVNLAADMGGVGYFHGGADWQASLDNGLITRNVLQACAVLDTDRLLYASSACAYPIAMMDRRLAEEWLGFGTPDALYGAEKLHGLRLHDAAPFDCRVAVLDTVYGPGQTYVGQRAKFPPSIAWKALTQDPVEVWGDGLQVRSYLYVDDAVSRLARLVEADTAPRIVNVGGEHTISCLDAALLCIRLAGRNVPVKTVPGPVGVQHREGLDLTRWRHWFGEPDDRPLEHGFGLLVDSLRRAA